MKNPRLQKGQTLVATLLVLVIIAILVVVVLRGSNTFGSTKQEQGRADGRGGSIPGLVKAQAEDTVCKSNLTQIRMAIDMRRTTEDQPPSTLEDTRLGENFYKCPLGGERYQYDPSTGKVFCPHLGHEKY